MPPDTQQTTFPGHRNPTGILEEFARFPISGDRLKGHCIVQILPALETGGVERGTLEMTRAIIAEGGKAVVISNGGIMAAHIERAGAKHVTLPVHSKNPLRWSFIRNRVADVLDREEADLVHIRSRAPAWIAMAAARERALPVVTTIHSRFYATNPVKKFYNGIMVRGDRIIAISDYVAGLVTEAHPAAASRMTVVHRGVDTRQFCPRHTNAERIIRMSETLALPTDRRIIMLPARARPWKGAEALIDAAGRLQAQDFMVVLLGAMEGSEDFRDTLLARIKSAGLEDRFKLTPAVQDMPAALKLAHVVVMPSVVPEPFGRVAIEAQAMECPVVAFAHGGAEETINHGKTGWLVSPPGDAVALAAALEEALAMGKAARLEMGRKGRSRAERLFPLEAMCNKTIDLYLPLLRGGRRQEK